MPGLWLLLLLQIWAKIVALSAVTASQPSHMRRQSVLTHKGEVITEKKSGAQGPRGTHGAGKSSHMVAKGHKKTVVKTGGKRAGHMFFGKGKPGKRAAASSRRTHHKHAAAGAHHKSPRASLAETRRNATSGPATLVPAAGQSVALTRPASFEKGFTITFKVKVHNFLRNFQMLATTDKHALLLQVLGPSHMGNATKISAWFRTESGLGNAGRGVFGSDGQGQLMSQALSANTWHDVKYQKTLHSVSLTVDGQTVSSAANPAIIIHEPDFYLEAGSQHLLAGALAGSGDQALDGEMGDVAVVEGPPAIVAAPPASL